MADPTEAGPQAVPPDLPGGTPSPWVAMRRAHIGRRLLLWILLASSLVTLLLTSFQLYLDYRRDVDDIEARMAEIEGANVPSLVSSLWKLDRDQLQLQLDGIVRLPAVVAAQVRDHQGALSLSSGDSSAHAQIWRRIPLVYDDRGERRTIGELQVAASLDGVYQQLTKRALIILASQGVKTFLISFFILFIVHRVVTRHLVTLAGYFSRFDIRDTDSPPVLSRPSGQPPDELDQLLAAFADLQARLAKAYSDLSQANETLKADIAARCRAEAEITRLNQELENRVTERTAELEAANREMAAFTYSVSHDLRAPLRSIHGFAHLLAQEEVAGVGGNASHYLSRVQRGVERMESLIEDLLRLSKISQWAMEVHEIDLSSMAQTIADDLQADDSTRAVQWRIAPGVRALGDAGLLRIVLENLLGNAWKYTGKQEQARIEFGCEEDGGRSVYFVRDNGVGFDMRYREKLFIAFQRLHHPEEFPGSGIGLATVARIVRRHGGEVWAEAAVGAGACFRFTLGAKATPLSAA